MPDTLELVMPDKVHRNTAKDFNRYPFKNSSIRVSNLEEILRATPSTNVIDKSTQKQKLFAEINGIVLKCKVKNWDGYGASPISELSAVYAKDFIDLMRDNLPLPEATPQPDGELGLEWCTRNYHFALSISDEKEITYAIHKPKGKNRGVLCFDSFKLPIEIELFINEIAYDSYEE
ncbi:MAG: hypothetical protein FD145_759 [Candidatus Saganbacteria bacterium]|uniref:Uncharacterized protein n=1 Tax=Candidatus Saganbacteria bacterium TaxID=2575572 RepID=A0A833L145_UNCSA|nr:MAG: hypothetical protein FD145_759 [Candidatus Saganbacteria bacterium]